MSSGKKILIIVFIILSLSGTVATFLFNRDAPPVAALKIPDATKDFFRKLSDLGHVKFDFVDSIDIGDFNNDNDYSGAFKKFEDENFIVYYRNSGKEEKRAKLTLRYANEAIPDLAKFLGKYYYAKDAKKRKLPIYLAVSEDDFAAISKKVGGQSVEWAAGLTYNSYSSNGEKMCLGIILNSSVQDGGSTDLRKVVFHEMAHYNHFQCMDLLKKNEYLNWEVEGLASFFANDWNKKIPEGTDIADYSLQKDPENYIDSYWMGYHAFGLAYQLGQLGNILQNSYSKSLMEAIPQNVGCSMSEYDNQWRDHCNRVINVQ
jgi:hypothetical protein